MNEELQVQQFDIGRAVAELKSGRYMTRAGWNGKNQFIGYCDPRIGPPTSGEGNTLPYVWIRTVSGDRVPWLASQTDLLANDWELCEYKGKP